MALRRAAERFRADGTGIIYDAADAKRKMREWVGTNDKFYPHAAQHDFEAWLLPFWAHIERLAGHNKTAPPEPPEAVDHINAVALCATSRFISARIILMLLR